MGSTDEVKHPVIFFDGVCNLCNSSVNFIIKRDKKAQFRFSSLQGDFAKSNLPKYLVSENALQSLVLRRVEKTIVTKSTAALTIVKDLSGLWPLLYLFIIIPPFIRNFVYDLVAKNRYRMFGKRDACMIPTKELKDRFID